MLETNGLKKGDIIIEITTNRPLSVDGLWGKASSIIDFSATHMTTNVVDNYGNAVFGKRGFKFSDEGIVWKKAKKVNA